MAPPTPGDPPPPVRRTSCVLTIAVVWLAALATLVWRSQDLAARPFHGDEAVQAVKAGALFDSGAYHYDPHEFHGPSLYYFTLPILKLSGAERFADSSDAAFRMVPVLAGVLLLVLLAGACRALGGFATATAAILLAVSPAMSFYGRYYIQEMPLVACAGIALCAAWQYHRSHRVIWLALLGIALGLMYATKETSVIFFAAIAAATTAVLVRRWRAGTKLLEIPRARLWLHLLLMLLVAAAVAGALYSSLFRNPHGPLDSLRAFAHYAARSDGSGSSDWHRHPWYYYLQMLAWWREGRGPWWSEGMILLLAAAACLASLANKLPAVVDRNAAWFLMTYTAVLAVAYSCIPYKTPWNLLGFLHGMILLAGIGAAVVLRALPKPWLRALWIVTLTAGIVHLASQARRANGQFRADPRNPYVYAHTVPDAVRIARSIGEIAAIHPDGDAMRVHFITPDYWPLPYYLRRLTQTGYWHDIPAAPDAPLIVVDPSLQDRLEPLLKDHYHIKTFGLRPGVLQLLYVQQELWDRHLATKNR